MGITLKTAQTHINTGSFACHFACWYWFDTKSCFMQYSEEWLQRTSKTALLNDKIQQGGFLLVWFIFPPQDHGYSLSLRQIAAGYTRSKRPEQVKAASEANKQREQAERDCIRPRRSSLLTGEDGKRSRFMQSLVIYCYQVAGRQSGIILTRLSRKRRSVTNVNL